MREVGILIINIVNSKILRNKMDHGNIELYQPDDFDFDSIVLRRADPDDCD